VRTVAYGRYDGRELKKRALNTRERMYGVCENLIKLGVKYRDITPAAIVAGTDSATPTFYQYWGSADELIEEIYMDWMDNGRYCSPHLWAMVNVIRKEVKHEH
jgi:AcrR family transcriptional regulator